MLKSGFQALNSRWQQHNNDNRKSSQMNAQGTISELPAFWISDETAEFRLVTYWIQTEAHWFSAVSQNCIQNSSNSNA